MADAIERLTAALAGRYRIERELGAGGMATVYLAHDLRHERDVAIKVLHPELAAALGGDRFLSEIKTTARLQHPHILPLLDSGSADTFLFYVMPFIAGETLRARLERERQLPVEDALRITREVADALESAHALGVIHRDIKPENILLQRGHALVADFGIALAVQSAGGSRMTQTGLSLGTPQYMSPEQAMGERHIDARTDLYALGAVTYEMLTGDPPFTGSSVQAIVARVLTERPAPISTVRDTVPPAVEAAVLRALAKLPADRFSSIGEFVAALRADAPALTGSGAFTGGSRAGMTYDAGQAHSRRRVNAALAVTTVAALALAAWAFLRPATAEPARMFDAALPDSAPLSSSATIGSTGFGAAGTRLSVSPSGDFVVYTAVEGDSTALWYRSLVDASARRIAGTAGGSLPRISPDGTRIVFSAGGDPLLILPIEGGEPRRLLETETPSTIEWVTPSRVLVIGADNTRPIWLDPESGAVENRGTSAVSRCVFGHWIEADQRVLCSFNETATLLDPISGDVVPVRSRQADGAPGAPVAGVAFHIVDDRYMFFVSLDGELRAARYDRQARLLDRPVTIARGIRRDAVGAAQVALSSSGMLAFAPTGDSRTGEMVRLHTGKAPAPLTIERANFLRFDLTRDGSRLAAVVATPTQQELRIYDLRSGARQVWMRAAQIDAPLWNPQGDRIAVRIVDKSGPALLFGSPRSTTAPDTLLRGDQAYDALDFHADTLLLVRDATLAVSFRLNPTIRPVRVDTVATDAFYATVSPDGRRFAWHSSTEYQLFVGPFPPSAGQLQVASGAVEPLWLSSTALLYRTGVLWALAQFDPTTGALAGPSVEWGRDSRFIDTPGWSHRPSWDGGIIYSRSPEQNDARFLRFIPDFVTRMKRAVDEGQR